MRRLICIVFILTIWSVPAYAEIVVIVNRDNDVSMLTKYQVIDLYMGRYVIFPNGMPAIPLDQPVDSEIRKKFYLKLTGKTVSQINAYWARLIFTGRATPPRVVSDVEQTLGIVRENKNAVAYIPREHVDNSIKVVLSID